MKLKSTLQKIDGPITSLLTHNEISVTHMTTDIFKCLLLQSRPLVFECDLSNLTYLRLCIYKSNTAETNYGDESVDLPSICYHPWFSIGIFYVVFDIQLFVFRSNSKFLAFGVVFFIVIIFLVFWFFFRTNNRNPNGK